MTAWVDRHTRGAHVAARMRKIAGNNGVIWWAAVMFAGALACAPTPDREAVPSTETRALPVTVPSGLVDEVYASGITSPTQMEFAPDGRLFVLEQRGRVPVIKNGERPETRTSWLGG